MRIGSLFSGYGGLDIAVQAVLGGEVVWHVETEPAAAKVLAWHWPHVPNLGDVTAVDWSSLESVDVLTGGFPCQDVSSAGRRAGLRPGSCSGLWAHMARAVHLLRPEIVVIENVRGLLSAEAHSDLEPCPWCLGDVRERPLRALGAVLGDLAVLGYDAQWCSLRAADVGAAHSRERVFIVGTDAERLGREPRGHVAECSPGTETSGQSRRLGTRHERRTAADSDGEHARTLTTRARGRRSEASPRDTSAPAADPDRVGRDGEQSESAQGQLGRPEPVERAAADAARRRTTGHSLGDSADREGQASDAAALGALDWGAYAGSIQRWSRVVGRDAPAPTRTGERGGQQLSTRFVEWLMGLSEGHVTDVDGLTRRDELKLLGNGVVPQQATVALTWLLGHEIERSAS